MNISSEYVGVRSRPLEVLISPRQMMNYAAGTGENNPCYYDDERPEGIIAPPMLSVALTWPISGQFAQYWDQAGFPLEVLNRQVHYSEYLQWFRPMVPGDSLTISGEVKAILPHRAGTHLIIEYQAQDPQGKPVFLERIGGLLRGVKCLDRGKGDVDLPAYPNNFHQDIPGWEQQIHVDPLAAYVYDSCADIHFPIHSSAAFAHKVGLPRPIYHGTATLSLAVREIVQREAGADPRRVRALSCLFTGMVFPGTAIQLRVAGRLNTNDGETVYFSVYNQEGKPAIRDGCLRLA